MTIVITPLPRPAGGTGAGVTAVGGLVAAARVWPSADSWAREFWGRWDGVPGGPDAEGTVALGRGVVAGGGDWRWTLSTGAPSPTAAAVAGAGAGFGVGFAM